MGKGNVSVNKWLSDPRRFASLTNGSLFAGKEIFTKEHLKQENGVQGVIIQTTDGKDIKIERYRDIIMSSDNGTKIMLLACETQEEIHYAMPVRNMLYDALNYVEQIKGIQKIRKNEKVLKTTAEFLSGLKKDDTLCPVITLVFYYGEHPWDETLDLHRLLGLNHKNMELFKKYIPNYTINLIDPSKLEKLENFDYDLQMMFGILKCRKDKLALKKYMDNNKEYFSNIDEESYQAAKAMLGSSRAFTKEIHIAGQGGINMCQALEEWYQDGVNEGIEKGIKQSQEQDIRILIESFKELNISYEDTKCKLQEKYHLNPKQLQEYMSEVWV